MFKLQHSKLQISTSLWRHMTISRITKVKQTKLHGNPLNSCWVISVWTKVMDWQTKQTTLPSSLMLLAKKDTCDSNYFSILLLSESGLRIIIWLSNFIQAACFLTCIIVPSLSHASLLNHSSLRISPEKDIAQSCLWHQQIPELPVVWCSGGV